MPVITLAKSKAPLDLFEQGQAFLAQKPVQSLIVRFALPITHALQRKTHSESETTNLRKQSGVKAAAVPQPHTTITAPQQGRQE